MKTIYIKPVKGQQVLDPETRQPLAETGEHKPRSEYWLRRLIDGVVVETKPKTSQEQAA